MWVMLAKRIASIIPTLFIASIVVFLIIKLVPGDPATAAAGEGATKELIAQLRHQMGLDRPLVEQYWHWLIGVLHGNLGTSLISHESVEHAIARTIPDTVSVVTLALIFSVLLGIPGGILAGMHPHRAVDRITTTISSLCIAMPSFWLGLILVSALAIQHHFLPATGFVPLSQNFGEFLRHLVLPSFAMGIVGGAEVARQLRTAMAQALASDHVRTLRAKGLPPHLVIKHALKNSSVPLITILGLQVNRFLGATVVIEAVFGITGMGSLVLTATLQKDFTVIQGVILVMAVLVIVTNVIVDLLYRVVDPRIR